MIDNNVLKAFYSLADDIKTNINGAEYQEMIALAEKKNPWFEKNQTKTALINLAYLIESLKFNVEGLGFNVDSLMFRVDSLEFKEKPSTLNPKLSTLNILIICAGNIPAVAFHDIMCVLLNSDRAVIKLSKNDDIIIPFLLKKLASLMPKFLSDINLLTSDKNLLISDINFPSSHIDGVIATGSNSSSLVFEQYFRNIPHIIRKSRYSCAVIENNSDISGLEDDICLYFGLGCRSISHLFVPNGYNFAPLIDKLKKYSHFTDHNKYRNNLDYQKAVMMMNFIDFIDADAVLLRQNDELFSPVGVVNYSYYDDINEVYDRIKSEKDNLQCIAIGENSNRSFDVPSLCRFGDTQRPAFSDYADGVNTMQWLNSLQNN